MLEKIEEIYKENNTLNKKQRKPFIIYICICTGVILLSAYLRKMKFAIYTILVYALGIGILKYICYSKIAGVKILDIKSVINSIKKIRFNNTKRRIIEELKDLNKYDEITIKEIQEYYKNNRQNKVRNWSNVIGYVFNIISAVAVLLSFDKNPEIANLYMTLLSGTLSIGAVWAANSLVDWMLEGVTITKNKSESLYRIFTEILIEKDNKLTRKDKSK